MIKDETQHRGNLPLVTVVMPVYNEERFISSTTQQLLDQDYPVDKIEIIVVDGMSTDNTRDIVRQLAHGHRNIRLLDNQKRRSSSGRNIGFKAGTGEYFVIIDGHCYLPNNQVIRNIVDCFEQTGADCLGRPQPLDPPGLSPFQKAIAMARASKIGHGGSSFIFSDFEGFISPVSNGAAYRREVFEKVGYVDEDFDAAEDVEFNYRVEKAGLTCYTAPSLTIKYYPRESLSALFRQLTRYGQGRRRFVRKHPEALTVNQLASFFFALGVVLSIPALGWILLQGQVSLMSGLFTVPYVLYFTLVFFVSLQVAGKNGVQYLCVLPVIFLVIHFSLGWGFLKETIFKQRI